MRELYPLFILFLFICSCDPCENCSEPILFEPTANIVLINQDSIVSIDSALLVYDSLDSGFSSINSVLVDLRDSLMEIEDSLALGLIEYQDEKDALLDSIDKLVQDSIFLEDLAIDSNVSVLNANIIDINSGLIRIDSLFIPETGKQIDYEDSLTTWSLPLSFENEFSMYQLFIANEEFNIELDYTTFTEVDEERNVLIRAQDIKVINHTFDSLDACNENCIDSEATFTFYF